MPRYFHNPITGQRYVNQNGHIRYAKTSGDCGDGYYDPPRNEHPPPADDDVVAEREPNPFEKE